MTARMHPLADPVRLDGWERVLDPADRRRTVYWRRTLAENRLMLEWLAVKRREDGTWGWAWRVRNAPDGFSGVYADGVEPTLPAARRAADAAVNAGHG